MLLLRPTAENQQDLDHFMRSAGLALPYTTAANVLTADEAPRLAAQLRQAQRHYFDGLAPRRLRQEFTALLLPTAPLRLRPVQPEDSAQLLAWTNDPATRRQSFAPELVPPDRHEAWLAGQLAAPDRHLLLLAEMSDTGAAAGLIRFTVSTANEAGITATLSYSLGPDYRGGAGPRHCWWPARVLCWRSFRGCGACWGRLKPTMRRPFGLSGGRGLRRPRRQARRAGLPSCG
ncbi:GNAT family N-acetyltransferase [Hymenobacter sp. BRD67]|nr:GNAT family N-acetyltransferase [Hymenobacter sp. BRD67]QKG52778.1 GNAT family N-acetyltransferase [Hymenobacter sp. BRD67]